MKTEMFGNAMKCHARWTCKGCNSANVTRLMPPLRPAEQMFCRKCHKRTTAQLDLATVPQCWGGGA